MAKKVNKEVVAIALFLALVLVLGVGYALFTDQLTITGTANAKGSFDLEFTDDSCLVDSEGVGAATGVEISSDRNTLTVNVADLGYPGAGAQFKAVIKNVGTVPAKVKAVTPTNITGDGKAIKITGLDAITTSHPTIDPDGTCTVDFTVEWDENEPTLQDPVNGDSVSFSLVVDYEQDTTAFSGSADHQDN